MTPRPAPRSAKPRPPTHLRASTRRWWAQVSTEYELEPHHERLLTLAAEAWDRSQGAREAIAKHGAVYSDRFGAPRQRPEVAIERDARLAFARLIRELRLDVQPDEGARVPGLNGGRPHA